MMRTSKQDSQQASRRPDGLVVQVVLALISIALGVLLLFLPDIQVKALCYVFCGAVIAAGIGSISMFFITQAYKRLHEYGFALGVLLLVMGCIGLLRTEAMVADFQGYLGFAALLSGVLMLQGTVQLRVLGNRLWIPDLVLTALCLTGSALVLADARPVLEAIQGFAYWVLLITGALSLVSLLFSSIGVFGEKKRVEKAEKAQAEQEAAKDQQSAQTEPQEPPASPEEPQPEQQQEPQSEQEPG